MAGFDDEPPDFKDVIVQKLQTLYRRSRRELERLAPTVTAESRRLRADAMRPASGIHLGRLLAGSEGTLALVTEATLRTVPLPRRRASSLLPFGGSGRRRGVRARLLDPRWSPRRATSTTGGRSAWPATPPRRFASGSPRRPRPS